MYLGNKEIFLSPKIDLAMIDLLMITVINPRSKHSFNISFLIYNCAIF